MRPSAAIALPLLLLGSCGFDPARDLPQPPRVSELAASMQEATKQGIKDAAQAIFARVKAEGKQKLDAGPCIADPLFPDWVLDIAHNPRLPVDDLPENQCASFREGRTHHVIEMTPEGKFIRMQ